MAAPGILSERGADSQVGRSGDGSTRQFLARIPLPRGCTVEAFSGGLSVVDHCGLFSSPKTPFSTSRSLGSTLNSLLSSSLK